MRKCTHAEVHEEADGARAGGMTKCTHVQMHEDVYTRESARRSVECGSLYKQKYTRQCKHVKEHEGRGIKCKHSL